MTKFLTGILIAVLLSACAVLGFLYKTETDKNLVLRSETQKTAQDAKEEAEKLRSELAEEKKAAAQEKQKVLEQISLFAKERDEARRQLEDAKKSASKERELSLVATEDLEKVRKELASLQKAGQDLEEKYAKDFEKKKRMYETRILSLEAELSKSKNRFQSEAERYHYNLGVVYARDKDYEAAVREFKIALGYNPKSTAAHFNLGIIFDDYFKDKDNAAYHYRTYLELAPAAEDAQAVREWLKGLEK